MGTYSGFLLLEDLFDNLPEDSRTLFNESQQLFNPTVKIVEEDCGTLLGKKVSLSNGSIGLWDLATESRMTSEDVNFYLSQGIYSRYTRHPAYCTSADGVCKKCYDAGNPHLPPAQVGHTSKLFSEVPLGVSIHILPVGETQITVSMEGEFITRLEVYVNDQYTDNYSITWLDNGGATIDFPNPWSEQVTVFVRMWKDSYSPFLSYLSKTYAGNLLGSAPLDTGDLPVRAKVLQSRITPARLSSLENALSEFSQYIPPSYMEYLTKIRDPLEKELYILALYGVFYDIGV